MNLGVNIFGLKKIINTDTENVLCTLRDTGFSDIELLVYESDELIRRSLGDEIFKGMQKTHKYVLSYEKAYTFITELRSAGLDTISVHINFTKHDFGRTDEYIRNLIDFSRKTNVKTFVFGCSSDLGNFAEYLRFYAVISDRLSGEGIEFLYHNHHQELGIFSSGKTYLDYIIEIKNINLEADTGWLYFAGINVIDFLEKNKDRISIIHFKDMVINSGVPEFKAIGYGEVNIGEQIDYINKTHLNKRLIIDQDDSSDILKDLKLGYEYIRERLL